MFEALMLASTATARPPGPLDFDVPASCSGPQSQDRADFWLVVACLRGMSVSDAAVICEHAIIQPQQEVLAPGPLALAPPQQPPPFLGMLLDEEAGEDCVARAV